jgi:hypothetical protein
MKSEDIYFWMMVFLGFLMGFATAMAWWAYEREKVVDPELIQVTRSIVISAKYSDDEIDSYLSGDVVTSTEGIGYWVRNSPSFAVFQVGETYCVRISPNLPQGPTIQQNYGLGECKSEASQ